MTRWACAHCGAESTTPAARYCTTCGGDRYVAPARAERPEDASIAAYYARCRAEGIAARGYAGGLARLLDTLGGDVFMPTHLRNDAGQLARRLRRHAETAGNAGD